MNKGSARMCYLLDLLQLKVFMEKRKRKENRLYSRMSDVRAECLSIYGDGDLQLV
jgi:hypothetical protein